MHAQARHAGQPASACWSDGAASLQYQLPTSSEAATSAAGLFYQLPHQQASISEHVQAQGPSTGSHLALHSWGSLHTHTACECSEDNAIDKHRGCATCSLLPSAQLLQCVERKTLDPKPSSCSVWSADTQPMHSASLR